MAKRRAGGQNARMINEDAEILIGQMMFAIGQGADGVHIHRSAVAKMRERYEPTTYQFVEDNDCTNPKKCWKTTWQERSIYTLRYFEVIGRLAARYATNDGTPAIDERHFEQARVVVEATYYAEEATQAVVAKERGDICPKEGVPPPPVPVPPPGQKAANGKGKKKRDSSTGRARHAG
jgi:hypothetical protein